MPPPRRHWSLRYGLPIAGLVLFAGAYVIAMYLTVDVSRISASRTADDRDRIYMVLHLGLLFLAACAGFALGKWMNGLGVAIGTLFVAVLAVWMMTAQLGSFAIACHGGSNDIIRHWTC